jgi:CBS domain-containing protein
MTKVRDIMSLDAVWVPPETTLQEAARIMRDQDIGFLIIGDNDKLVGALTDRDIAVRGMAAAYHPQVDTVRSIMTQKIRYCYDDQDVEDVCDNMGELRVTRLPVLNQKKRLVGIVSLGDLAQIVEKTRIARAYSRIKRRNGTAAYKRRKAA